LYVDQLEAEAGKYSGAYHVGNDDCSSDSGRIVRQGRNLGGLVTTRRVCEGTAARCWQEKAYLKHPADRSGWGRFIGSKRECYL